MIKDQNGSSTPYFAVACGGTGGHLYPGLAVLHELRRRGADVMAIASEKAIDRRVLEDFDGGARVFVPAAGWNWRRFPAFARGIYVAYRRLKKEFRRRRPDAVLAMGGFVSAGPVWAARRKNIPCFFHEANSIPGKATRYLGPGVRNVFFHFPEALKRWPHANGEWTGMPSRFEGMRPDWPDRESACRVWGFDPERPVLLAAGGSQGAQAINHRMIQAAASLRKSVPEIQILHLSGESDLGRVQSVYQRAGLRAVTLSYADDMTPVLAAASAAVARAGASTLAELAAMELPSLLVPYPHAADRHQYFNAKAFADEGAAVLCEQEALTPEGLSQAVAELLKNSERRGAMQKALRKRASKGAGAEIAGRLFQAAFPGGEVPTAVNEFSAERIGNAASVGKG